MIVLGIDPGTRHTGYGVVEVAARKEAALDYGAVDLPPNLDHTLRLQRIYAAVLAVIDAHHPDECAVEMPVYGQDAQAMLKLGRAQAAVMLAAAHRGVPVTQYTPKEVKKAVVGNGNAAKEQVWYMVRAQLGLTEPRGLDASDALAVALCHAHRVEQGPTGKFKDWKSFVAANPRRVR
ncbi:MAG TPA: crossover junction endodeoxyribonuclease RuvC [Rubricoccaceae bacterium]|jgi:crossover junction endodeoxyribonuclease RuvC|nr:crossover junction endodeoxyribonuclease RuvC [Rubricoccaceae bacterium]